MVNYGLDYELIDFGRGRKLERFGEVVLDRPEVLASGKTCLDLSAWKSKTDGVFTMTGKNSGKWLYGKSLPDAWEIAYTTKKFHLSAELKPGKFKHVGIFPEQEKHWKFLTKILTPGQRMLNLFAYTGMASLVGSRCGADVFHVDSSKSILKQARHNASRSDIANIHWVCEDAMKFLSREIRRGNAYDIILMDPPVFGRGAGGERWQIEEQLPHLVKAASRLLKKDGKCILNTYSPRISIDTMQREFALNRLRQVDSGWLSVYTRDGRGLELSKYTIGEL